MRKIFNSPKKLFIIFLIIFFISPNRIDASSYEYDIRSYDINIVVNENNILDITEKIDAYFYIEKHGIYRKIPLKNEVVRLDGTTTRSRARITNIKVSDNYKESLENEYKVLQIGDADYTLTGPKDYTISYSYNLGKDSSDEYDELYFNLIGTEWDTNISNVTFTITMPKEFDETKLGFSSGTFGSTDSSNIIYTVDDNVITGSLNTTLESNEGLTIRLELPEGYFKNAGLQVTPLTYLMFIIPAIGAILAIFLWKKYGKDDQVIETVEFYPPEGFNSLEVGYLYKGKAESEDVTSLLIYLANKGYLKINEKEEKNLFGKSKTFEIEKIKEYDGNNKNERIFFNGLFIKKDKVTEDDLYNKFYLTQREILEDINSKQNKNNIFESKSSSKSKIIILSIIISVITIIGIPTLEYADIEELLITLILILFYTPFYAVGLSDKLPKVFKIFWLGFTIFHSFMFFSAMPIAYAITAEPIFLKGVIFGVICLIGMIICFKIMPKRTKYGNEMLGKIKGFKRFLETAEKEQLESMVLKEPTYFYNILPYTYVLGVSDKWISKFESINLQAPDWYDNPAEFNVNTFGTFMNNTMSSAKTSMSTSPSSSSSGGGGFSGGGSSGGGSGGGGGGSW